MDALRKAKEDAEAELARAREDEATAKVVLVSSQGDFEKKLAEIGTERQRLEEEKWGVQDCLAVVERELATTNKELFQWVDFRKALEDATAELDRHMFLVRWEKELREAMEYQADQLEEELEELKGSLDSIRAKAVAKYKKSEK